MTTRSRERAVGPGLPVDEIHVWELDLARQPTADPGSDLQSHELVRAGSLISREAGRRFLNRRLALRRILGAYLGVPAPLVDLDAPPGEKPRLADAEIDLRFNLSHTGDAALLAVLLDREVGIDIEPLDAGSRLIGATTDFLSPGERREMVALSGAALVSYLTRAWVRKEAYAKAIGAGLRVSLRDVEFQVAEPWGVARLSASADGRTWSVTDLDLVDGHAAALVVEGAPTPIRALKWPDPPRDATATVVGSGQARSSAPTWEDRV